MIKIETRKNFLLISLVIVVAAGIGACCKESPVPTAAPHAAMAAAVYPQTPCREEPATTAETVCLSGTCLDMTLCGLIGFTTDNSSATAYFVDANPASRVASDYPLGADLSSSDLETTFKSHYVELTVKVGSITEFELGNPNPVVPKCTARPGVPCPRLSNRDLDLTFAPIGLNDPAPIIDLGELLNESRLERACPDLDQGIEYLKLDSNLDLTNSASPLEARIKFDRGTSLKAEAGQDCPKFELAKVESPLDFCRQGPLVLSEKVRFKWTASTPRFILQSSVKNKYFVLEPGDEKSIVVSLTNEATGNDVHDHPFRWLYRLATNNSNIDNHIFLPMMGYEACWLIGSKCPPVLLSTQ